MGYQVKWVQENLGVSRKALRGFEKEGLMPENENRQYREYSEEDIDRIWTIRVLQGMGYSLKEIFALTQNESFDFNTSITEKIAQLEKDKANVERHLGYAKMIKLTGRIPSRPKEIGTIKFSEFQERALEDWNINAVPAGNELLDMFEVIMKLPEEQWTETELGQVLLGFMNIGKQLENPGLIATAEVLPKAIVKRMELGADHPEVQLLVKLLYEELYPDVSDISPRQFGRIRSSYFVEGDIGLANKKRFGAEGCAFLADAIAIFGGFLDYEDSMKL